MDGRKLSSESELLFDEWRLHSFCDLESDASHFLKNFSEYIEKTDGAIAGFLGLLGSRIHSGFDPLIRELGTSQKGVVNHTEHHDKLLGKAF